MPGRPCLPHRVVADLDQNPPEPLRPCFVRAPTGLSPNSSLWLSLPLSPCAHLWRASGFPAPVILWPE